MEINWKKLRDVLQDWEGVRFNKFGIILKSFNFSKLFSWYISSYFWTSGYPWLNLAVSDYLGLSQEIFGYLWQSLAISGYIRLSQLISDYIWLSLNISEYLWLYLAIYEYFWLSLAIPGNLRPSQAISGYLNQVSSIGVQVEAGENKIWF